MNCRWGGLITEKRAVLALIGLFFFMAFLIGSLPYDPQTDLADAVTNDIWVEHYAQGVYSIPFSDWSYGITQSVVVWHDGQYTVVNEKGPGHALMLVPFYMSGTGFLFGPLMVALAILSAYMLGKRLLNWRVGAIAALLVLTDVSVVMMWYRYYWTDASTMALLVLSIWLAVEANYWMNGRSLNPRVPGMATRRQQLLSLGMAACAGVAFGASTSTRYATALILIPILLYFAAFYLTRAWPMLKEMKILAALRSSMRMWPILAGITIGLICILAPLMAYNSDYFGGPLYSGYDATTLQQFTALGNTTDRNTSTDWMSTSADNALSAASNLLIILPVLLARMPFLILLPIGIWLMRRSIPALILLSAWIAVNFYTYSSISWVSMYATMPAQILFEPRYFIPSVPPIAIFAGLAIERLAAKASDWRARIGTLPRTVWFSRAALVAIAITGILVLCSLVPAAGFFANSGQQMNGNPQGGPPDQNGPHNGNDANGGPPPRAGNLSGGAGDVSKIGKNDTTERIPPSYPSS